MITERASRARAEAAQRALVERVGEEARAADEDEHQQAVDHEHAGRDGHGDEAAVLEAQPRLDDRDVGQERQRRDEAGLRDLEVVALRRVAHPVPVQAEHREDEDAADDDEADRPREEIGVQLGDLAVEPELVGEVVGEGDQPRVERHLGQAVAVERRGGRRAEPPAHPRDSTREVVASLLAREAVRQQVREHSRVAAHAVGARGRAPAASRLRTSTSSGRSSCLQPPVGDQPLVDRAEPALERGPHGRAERDRLAVHRAARGDDDVGVRDQRLRVDGALGDDVAAGRRRAPRAARACAGARRSAPAPRSRSSSCAKSGCSKRW